MDIESACLEEFSLKGAAGPDSLFGREGDSVTANATALSPSTASDASSTLHEEQSFQGPNCWHMSIIAPPALLAWKGPLLQIDVEATCA